MMEGIHGQVQDGSPAFVQGGDTVKLNTLKAALSRVEKRKQAIERSIREYHARQLTALPRRVGLEDVDSLVLALIPLTSPSLRERLNAGGILDAVSVPESARDRNIERRRFSSDVRDKIKAELRSGHKSTAELSREYGVSPRTIMNWKREWGLTQQSNPKRSSPTS